LKVEDIPGQWNLLMKSLLGVDVPNDGQGCLQDIHWSAFAIGYFPTYLLGSSTAAQLAYYCEKDIPDMYEKVENGQFQELKDWLTSKIHKHGKRYKSLDDLLEAELGEKLNPQYFIQYLESKYSKLYSC
jgi:carboxypeptidase Taq